MRECEKPLSLRSIFKVNLYRRRVRNSNLISIPIEHSFCVIKSNVTEIAIAFKWNSSLSLILTICKWNLSIANLNGCVRNERVWSKTIAATKSKQMQHSHEHRETYHNLIGAAQNKIYDLSFFYRSFEMNLFCLSSMNHKCDWIRVEKLFLFQSLKPKNKYTQFEINENTLWFECRVKFNSRFLFKFFLSTFDCEIGMKIVLLRFLKLTMNSFRDAIFSCAFRMLQRPEIPDCNHKSCASWRRNRDFCSRNTDNWCAAYTRNSGENFYSYPSLDCIKSVWKCAFDFSWFWFFILGFFNRFFRLLILVTQLWV